MKYIFSYIEKVPSSPSWPSHSCELTSSFSQEKQAENIVEKLCQRFRLSEDPRQWRDIAYCMSLLPFKSDRSVKKLIEGLQFYRDKLHEEAVFARFQEILTKVRRSEPLWSRAAHADLVVCRTHQARANKSANKPDAELNEFEQVRPALPHLRDLAHSFPIMHRSWKRAVDKAQRIRSSRGVSRARKSLCRRAANADVSHLAPSPPCCLLTRLSQRPSSAHGEHRAVQSRSQTIRSRLASRAPH